MNTDKVLSVNNFAAHTVYGHGTRRLHRLLVNLGLKHGRSLYTLVNCRLVVQRCRDPEAAGLSAGRIRKGIRSKTTVKSFVWVQSPWRPFRKGDAKRPTFNSASACQMFWRVLETPFRMPFAIHPQHLQPIEMILGCFDISKPPVGHVGGQTMDSLTDSFNASEWILTTTSGLLKLLSLESSSSSVLHDGDPWSSGEVPAQRSRKPLKFSRYNLFEVSSNQVQVQRAIYKMYITVCTFSTKPHVWRSELFLLASPW